MKHTTLAFIGAGNMSRSLIAGLINNGYAADAIVVADPNSESLQHFADNYGVRTFSDNLAALAVAEIIITAVKPQQMQIVCKQLATQWSADKLLVSIAAGIRLEAIERWLAQPNAAVVRAMPNTPSMVQAGATGLCANRHVSTTQHEQAESILRAVGVALWVNDEALLDTVTALSGSGPAYFFLVMEAMQNAAIAMGLDDETARLLTLETAFGAAKMALESDESVSVLRQRVTSPGGTTERAIAQFETGNLRGLFANALRAAADRADEMAQQLGQDHD